MAWRPEWVWLTARTAWMVIEIAMEHPPDRSQSEAAEDSKIVVVVCSANNGHGLKVLSLTGRCAFKKTSHVKILELLLPSSAQGAVQLHQRESFIQYGLRQVQPRGKVARIAVQHFEITHRAAVVARI